MAHRPFDAPERRARPDPEAGDVRIARTRVWTIAENSERVPLAPGRLA
jgi:hypothetical protein